MTTAQQLIDEVHSWKPSANSEKQDTPARAINQNGVATSNINGLFTIPQEELSEISWKELRKVSK